MADEVVNISLQADISALTAQLARLGPEGDKEAKKLVDALQRQYKRAEDAAKKTAKVASAAFSGEFNKISSAGAAMASAIGGSFGQIGGLAQGVLKPLAEVSTGLGAVAIGAIGAAAAAGGLHSLATSAIDLADSAGAAGERLGKLAVLTDDETLAVREFAAMTKAAAIEQDLLTVRLAQGVEQVAGMQAAWVGLNGTLADGAGVFASTVDWAHDFRTAAFDTVPVLGDLWIEVDRLMGPGSQNLGLNPVVNAVLAEMRTNAEEATLELDQTYAAMQKLTKAGTSSGIVHADTGEDLTLHLLKDEQEALEDVAEGARQNAIEKERLAVANAKAAEATRELAAADKAFGESMAAGTQIAADAANANIRVIGFNRELAETISAINIAGHAAGNAVIYLDSVMKDYNETLHSGADVSAQIAVAFDHLPGWVDDATAAVQSGVNAFSSMAGGIRDLQAQIIEGVREQATAQIAAATQVAEDQAAHDRDAIERQLASGEITNRQAADRMRQVDDQLAADLDAADKLGDDERQRAMDAFHRSQSLAYAQAAIAAAVSAVSLIPSFSWAGPFAPLLAASVAGAAFGVQAAVISGQSPPEFTTGMSADHFAVGVQRGEPILSRRANAELEGQFGPDAAERMNRGERPSPQGRQDMGFTVGIDPRLRRLRVTSDHRPGKRPRRGR